MIPASYNELMCTLFSPCTGYLKLCVCLKLKQRFPNWKRLCPENAIPIPSSTSCSAAESHFLKVSLGTGDAIW